jgi:hypothetical protein
VVGSAKATAKLMLGDLGMSGAAWPANGGPGLDRPASGGILEAAQ